MKKRILSLVLILALATSVFAGNVSAAKKKSKKPPEFTLVSQNTSWTNQNVKIKVVLKKGVKAKQILWKSGKSTKSAKKYWKKAKNITKGKSFYATNNGWYSVKITDKQNQVKRKSIYVSNIDKTGAACYVDYTVENKVATVSAFTADEMTGISFAGYARGYLQSKNVSDYTVMNGPFKEAQVYVEGTIMSPTHQFLADQPGYWTICVRDGVGNVSLWHVYVQLWTDLSNLTPFDKKVGGLYEGTIYDRWEKAYTNPVGIAPSKDGSYYVEYFLNGNFKNLSGSIVRGKGVDDDDVIWLEILADDVVIYTSPKMDYKSQAVPFELNLSNAKYIKIKAYAQNYWYSSWDSSSSKGIYLTDAKLYN